VPVSVIAPAMIWILPLPASANDPANSPEAAPMLRVLFPSCTVPLPARFCTLLKLVPALISNVAPAATSTTLEKAIEPKPDSANVPALIVVVPV
jgi:hypothetical protein